MLCLRGSDVKEEISNSFCFYILPKNAYKKEKFTFSAVLHACEIWSLNLVDAGRVAQSV